MTKLSAIVLFFLIYCNTVHAQQIPVTVLNSADTSKPLIFYISGDGGWNKFSTSLIHIMNTKGYPVVGLDAKQYFWHKKTANQTAKDVIAILDQYSKTMKARNTVLIGYSFGADVMPFVVTRMDKAMLDKLKYTVLMSPSATTDFEVHFTDMLGIGKRDGDSVPAEINKIIKPLLFVFGDKEDDFPVSQLTIKNYKVDKLPGGHHYDGDPAAVFDMIITYIK